MYLNIQFYESIRIQKQYDEYYELETCDKMEERFARDLENGEIKYFQLGIAYDVELEKILKKEYDIEMFGMGCLVQSEFECYNELVYDFLKEKYNKSINDIMEKYILNKKVG